MDKQFDKMELIKIEMNLLQGRFDKYDDLSLLGGHDGI